MAERCVFGPVPSRRFGRSLGIDIVPLKVCSVSCVYCQLGATASPTLERDRYVTLEDVERDLPPAIGNSGGFDVVTFSGSGEPTLNIQLGEIIRYAKALTGKPIVVLTNGTLLWMPDVREDLAAADIVAPSLDAADDETFRLVNRPPEGMDLAKVVDGMVEFSRVFTGEIRLEVFLVEGLNDSEEHVRALAGLASRIAPDRVELNTAERRPSEPWVKPVPRKRLEELALLFEPKAEIISASRETGPSGGPAREVSKDDILAYLARRPAGARELAGALGGIPEAVETLCDELIAAGEIRLEKGPSGSIYVSN